jgi:anti-anti-sigma factor
MEITKKEQGGFTIVSPCGRLGFDEASEAQAAFESAISECSNGVVVDCGSLDYVSSAGLRAFLVGAKAAETKGVSFSACALDENVESVFTISGFDRIVSLYATLEDALG